MTTPEDNTIVVSFCNCGCHTEKDPRRFFTPSNKQNKVDGDTDEEVISGVKNINLSERDDEPVGCFPSSQQRKTGERYVTFTKG